GFFGGVEWHGASFDPDLNVLYVNANDASTIHSLRPISDLSANEKLTTPEAGRRLYETSCIACHGADRKGTPPLTPPLRQVTLSPAEIASVISEGRNT